jgi:hypothetical protein
MFFSIGWDDKKFEGRDDKISSWYISTSTTHLELVCMVDTINIEQILVSTAMMFGFEYQSIITALLW